MLAATDIETYTYNGKTWEPVLDCTQYALGCIKTEDGNTIYTTTKQEHWKKILELAEKARKKKSVLNIYAHNHSYDYYAYADLYDPRTHWYCDRPFIVSYHQYPIKDIPPGMKNKVLINFLDTWAIFKGSLKELGHMIGKEKKEMPGTCTNLEELKEYVERDTDIVLSSILWLKQKLKEDDIPIKHYYTKNQIAIGAYFNYAKKKKECEFLFLTEQKRGFKWTKEHDIIHAAYRGGRNHCWKIGTIENITEIDCNSLYPYAAIHFNHPNPHTTRTIKAPLYKIGQQELLNNIGVSECLVENKNDWLGTLQVRLPLTNHYPRPGTLMIGTWTHEELREAIRQGYIIHEIRQSTIWEESYNPLKEYMEKLYYKKEHTQGIERDYYKSLMNSTIGKLGQRKRNQELIMDSLEEAELYLKRGYIMKNGLDEHILYKKEEDAGQLKPYYLPIVPALITAKARIYMNTVFRKLDREQLVYTDTDSLMFTGKLPHVFPKGERIGEFKTVLENTNVHIWGKKTYRIGEEYHASGIHKKDVTPEAFNQGKITTKTMNTIQSIQKTTPGTFTEVIHDLKEQSYNYVKAQELLNDITLHIDYDIKDITFYHERLKELGSNTKI